jgi:hypothetical protein
MKPSDELITVSRGNIRYCDDPPLLRRIYVRVRPDGTVFVRGLADEVAALITALRADGHTVQVEYQSLCG